MGFSVGYTKARNIIFNSHSYKDLDVVIIDELQNGTKMYGAEPDMKELAAFYDFFEYRKNSKKSDVLIANSVENIVKMYGEGTADRMKANKLLVRFNEKSFRKMIKMEDI